MVSLALAVLISGTVATAQIPHYTNGMTGTFGAPEAWSSGNIFFTFDSTTDEFSARFTALENLAVSRAYQQLRSVDAGTTIRMGIMADDGTGKPSGTYLAYGDNTFSAGFTGQTNWSFSSSASLSSGNVYHLVTQVTSLPASQTFNILGGTSDFAVRPYDRAVDANMNGMTRNNAGAWGTIAFDPYFALGNASTILGGPGQPVTGQGNGTGLLSTRGGASSAFGEQFVITDKEIPAGASVAFNTVTMNASTVGSPASSLLIRFRKLDGTILGTTVMTPAQATGANITLTLDQQVELMQGVSYLLTTEFAGASVNTQYYTLGTHRTDGGFETGLAGWGGTNLCFPVLSGAAGNWSTYSPDNLKANYDPNFSFTGIVVPEPSVVALLAGVGPLLFRRRRQ